MIFTKLPYKVSIPVNEPSRITYTLEMSRWCKGQGLRIPNDYRWEFDNRDSYMDYINFYFADENLANWFKIRWM